MNQRLKVLLVKHCNMQIFNFFQSNLPAIQKGITSTNVLTLTGPMPDEERKLT